MDVKVVDASALAALLFAEPEAPLIAARLSGGRLVAPALMAFELANVALIKARRNPELGAKIAEAFACRNRLAIEEITVDQDAVLSLAASTGLTAYDASYLLISRTFGAELVTLDQQLARAAAAPAPRQQS